MPGRKTMKADYVLKFERQVRYAIWGTESWEISVHKSGPSIVANGPLAGRPLPEVCPDFNLLIKVIDAKDRLSVQVHPNAKIAPLLGGVAKTEMWCMLSNGPIYAGLIPNTSERDVADAIAAGRLESLVHRHKARKGEVFFIPGGEVHSIDAGAKLYEVQQSSDTTYRLYDWGRLSADGRPRELHIEKGLKSIDYSLPSPAPQRSADCPYFSFSQLDVSGDVPFGPGEGCIALFAAEGELSVNGEILAEGESALVPPGVAFTLSSRSAHVFMTRGK